MTPKLLSILFLLFFSLATTYSQVGIGTTSPDISSILDIESDAKGILIPRMTTAERNLIADPANGLLLYNTDSDEFQFNSNSPGTPIWQAFDMKPTSSSNIGQSVKYSNTDVATNVNAAPGINAPILGTLAWNDNTSLYSANTGTHEITIGETGRYKVVVNISLSTADTRDRMAPEMRITVNGTQVGSYSSTGYIRTNNNHQEASLHLVEILEVSAGETIAILIQEAANASNATNTVEIREAGSATIYIEKLM